MSRGSTGLDSNEYDDFLARGGKEKELRSRNKERRNANKGYEGWHFGLGERPVYCKNKEEFNKALVDRGLAIKNEKGDAWRPMWKKKK